MQANELDRATHGHDFGLTEVQAGERRTRWVVALTAVMMVVEIVAGLATRSMALLADGWHMATHAAALGVAVFAYAYARKHARDPRFSFGTGKVGALGGFASAVSLAVVAVYVLAESVARLLAPEAIRFDEALRVALLGLVVNLASAWLLRDGGREHEHGHEHGNEHGHEHTARAAADHHDHNLRGAYLHVLADALTSVLAIGALLAGKHLGWTWVDAVTGILGALLIARWSFGLSRDASAVLLDAEVSEERQRGIRAALEAVDGDRVADLHVWRVGPRHLAVLVSVVTRAPRAPDHYKARLARFTDLVHVTVEVQPSAEARSKSPG